VQKRKHIHITENKVGEKVDKVYERVVTYQKRRQRELGSFISFCFLVLVLTTQVTTDYPRTSFERKPFMISVITIRLIKSFEYRTFKNLLLRDVDEQSTVGELKQRIVEEMQTASGMKPYLNVHYGNHPGILDAW
jgi:hypothetical protein